MSISVLWLVSHHTILASDWLSPGGSRNILLFSLGDDNRPGHGKLHLVSGLGLLESQCWLLAGQVSKEIYIKKFNLKNNLSLLFIFPTNCLNNQIFYNKYIIIKNPEIQKKIQNRIQIWNNIILSIKVSMLVISDPWHHGSGHCCRPASSVRAPVSPLRVYKPRPPHQPQLSLPATTPILSINIIMNTFTVSVKVQK